MSILWYFSFPHSSVLVLCYILNTDFCLAYRSFCSATAFHRTSRVSATGLTDICLCDPNSQGMHGNEREKNPSWFVVVKDLPHIFSTALELLCAPWTGFRILKELCLYLLPQLFMASPFCSCIQKTNLPLAFPAHEQKCLIIYNTQMIFHSPCSVLS